MTEIPAPVYALRLLGTGEPLRKAADQSGLEVGAVVAALLDDWRKQRAGTPTQALTGPGWEPYLRHPSAKVVRAAERLRDVFTAEDEKAGLLAEKKRLEAQLARVKAQLSNGRPTTTTATASGHECPDCGNVFLNLGVHRARKHGYRPGAGDAA